MLKEPDFELDLTVDEIRQLMATGDPLDNLDSVLDQAQGVVYTGQQEASVILITVRK